MPFHHTRLAYVTRYLDLVPAAVDRNNETGQYMQPTAYSLSKVSLFCGYKKQHVRARMHPTPIHTGTASEARLASARQGNLNLWVLRDRHDPNAAAAAALSAQQPSTVVNDKEKRRTLLHYFVFRPSDEESAERGGLGCSSPGRKTSGWFC